MQFAVRAETSQTADHRRASRALLAEVVQDGLPEWVVVPGGLVMLPDVDANALARPYDVHSATLPFQNGSRRVRLAPTHTPISPTALLPST